MAGLLCYRVALRWHCKKIGKTIPIGTAPVHLASASGPRHTPPMPVGSVTVLNSEQPVRPKAKKYRKFAAEVRAEAERVTVRKPSKFCSISLIAMNVGRHARRKCASWRRLNFK